MENIKIIEHKGKKIVFQSWRDIRDAEKNIAIIEETKQLIMKMPEKSVLLLTDATNAHYDINAIEHLKAFSKDITPYIKASAVVGVSGIKRVILQTLIKISGRDIKMCSDIDEALDYLANHK
ncbi:MAG: hypothetical protein COX48_05255 [bacterium (Candidatus Stahlbacteria) CG23_combo_of_CG06-09_8_20_14_all_34_7]|nr:MAG: hypothetical protein COX48_05255 [bacterium (Candidatus Stahlbacteria) CG23_combo_of_CG06-09_8_20_14_all_34_7]